MLQRAIFSIIMLMTLVGHFLLYQSSKNSTEHEEQVEDVLDVSPEDYSSPEKYSNTISLLDSNVHLASGEDYGITLLVEIHGDIDRVQSIKPKLQADTLLYFSNQKEEDVTGRRNMMDRLEELKLRYRHAIRGRRIDASINEMYLTRFSKSSCD